MKNGPELWDAILADMRKWFPESRMVIAGGAVRDYYLGFEPKDIDVFVNVDDELDFDFAIHDMGDLVTDLSIDTGDRYSAGNWSDEGRIYGAYEVNLAYEDRSYSVQIIGKKFADWKELVSSFDFDIVRCAYEGVLRDTPEAANDRKRKRFTLPHSVKGYASQWKSEDRFSRFRNRSAEHRCFTLAFAKDLSMSYWDSPNISPVSFNWKEVNRTYATSRRV